jgi:hypothetical protein
MTTRSGRVGLLAVITLALSATAAASAQAIQFHSEVEHTIVTAPQTTAYQFTAGEGFGAISCESVVTTGTGAAATETESLGETIVSGCKDSFGRTVDIDNNECKTRYHATAEKSPGTFSGVAALVCPSGKDKVATITSGGSVVCTLTAQSQENMGPATIHNLENGKVEVTLEAANLQLTTSGGFFNCGVSNGEHTGSVTGASTATGTNTEGRQVKIWVG